uniref:Movement protein TGBp3 n=11 Tax=Strawberry mild yellow edge-associated virus TaxID=12187 RepID=A0A0N7IDH2_SMYEA|nr:triple gene block 3 [Strawberry mild yellow edge virus]ALJ53418.1 triple gene block protein 3 [Strawberry mild yellow edge virus]
MRALDLILALITAAVVGYTIALVSNSGCYIHFDGRSATTTCPPGPWVESIANGLYTAGLARPHPESECERRQSSW